MRSRYKDVIFLLGAGASAEAGIPTSAMMVKEIEQSLQSDEGWKSYYKLYNHIKSGIYYAFGLDGIFYEQVNYNIETLVNTLYELERNEQHPLYPFIASMNSRLTSLAGPNFENVRNFRKLILDRLKKWMSPDDIRKCDYYYGLKSLQQHFNYPLHIFSLNYDLCVERLNCDTFRIETGFADIGPSYNWDWERFEESLSGPEPPQIYLYKLHGSVNWKRDRDTKLLYCVDQTASIDSDTMELIFGRNLKVETADPYLFYLYAFRVATLSAKLIVLIGYGFGDSHINKMLSQALRDDKERKVLAVGRCSEDETNNWREEVADKLSAPEGQVILEGCGAKNFLQQDSLGQKIEELIPISLDAPF